MTEPTIDDVRAAAKALEGRIARTLTSLSRTLSSITGASVYIKFENQQFTASFKERGACTKLLSLTAAERARGVVAMSAGNHAQGVAYHAAKLGIPATIVMPRTTPFVKIRQTRDHGARVLLDGDTLVEAAAAAAHLAATEGLVFVHPYDDPLVIAGQGTVALEMLEDQPDLDDLIVPVGGGGLIAGMAVASRAIAPGVRMIGVESALYPSMINAIYNQDEPCGGATIAEGIAVKTAGSLTRRLVSRLVDAVVTVSESELEQAIGLYLSIEKTVTEGAGAAPLAALIAAPERFRGRKVGLVLSGGNIDLRLLGEVIMRNLVREGRVAGLRVNVTDTPGTLARIATIVGEAGGNILEVSHQRMFLDVPAKNTELDLVIETRDPEHMAEIITRITAAGYPVRRLSSSTADG